MAEGAFRDTVQKLGYADRFHTIDSCGTAAYHEGEEPDARTISTLKKNGIHLDHLARQVRTQDFHDFDYLLAMDNANLRDLKNRQPRGSKAKVLLFGHFSDSKDEVVEDPYYGGQSGFSNNFKQIVRFSKNFLRDICGAEVNV